MAVRYVCDRCGKQDDWAGKVETLFALQYHKYDLCRSCQNALEAFIRTSPERKESTPVKWWK